MFVLLGEGVSPAYLERKPLVRPTESAPLSQSEGNWSLHPPVPLTLVLCLSHDLVKA